MTTKITNKRKVLVGLAAVALIIATSVVTVSIIHHNNKGLEVYRSGNGWGYKISGNGKVFINQPFIPAVVGMKPFETRRDAARTGRMVIKKLRQGKRPTLTVEELKKAGIIT